MRFASQPNKRVNSRAVSTAKEIEVAIQALSPAEREKLVDDLPSILPELRGEAAWQHILRDPRPRPALTGLGDKIAAEMKANPAPVVTGQIGRASCRERV